jgi:hypothetical protein
MSNFFLLQNYKAKDSGTYTCNIKNDAGEANVELTLNIEGELKIKIKLDYKYIHTSMLTYHFKNMSILI